MISRRQLLVLAGAAPFWPALKSSAGVQSTTQAAQTPITSKTYRVWEARPRPLWRALWPPEEFNALRHDRALSQHWPGRCADESAVYRS